MGIPSKIMVNCLVCRFVGLALIGIEKRKPDGDGTPRNKKNVVLQELARKRKALPLWLWKSINSKTAAIWKQ